MEKTKKAYNYTAYLPDIQQDIAKELEEEYPNMPFRRRYEIAEKALEKINSLGNMALREGLVLNGTNIAKEIIKNS